MKVLWIGLFSRNFDFIFFRNCRHSELVSPAMTFLILYNKLCVSDKILFMANEKKFKKEIDTTKNHIEDSWENGHHQKYWIDNKTGEIIADAYENYKISPAESCIRKSLRKEFINSVLPLYGIVFTNVENGFKARFSKNTANKISSDKAITKSVVNGFSVENHFEVAKNIKWIFEQAHFVGTFPDKRNDPNIIAIHRFEKEVELSNNRKCYVSLTLKEVRKNGIRIYTIELLLNKYPL